MGDRLLERVETLYGDFRAWRKVGQEVAAQAHERGIISDINGNADGYGVLANAIYRQAIEDSPTLRKALGLPPKTVPIPPCPECGEVHERYHLCDDERKRTKRTKANGWLRRAAWLTTEQAARFDAAREAAGVSVGDILMKWTERQEVE